MFRPMSLIAAALGSTVLPDRLRTASVKPFNIRALQPPDALAPETEDVAFDHPVGREDQVVLCDRRGGSVNKKQ